jgi:nitrate reductase gamma subunit
MGVSCQACHLKDVAPLNLDSRGPIVWRSTAAGGTVSILHQMRLSKNEGCTRCHFDGTLIGAPAMVLPAKGVLCMSCHAATLSVGDTITVVSLLIFLLGIAALSTLWLGGVPQGTGRAAIPAKILQAVGRGLAVLFSSKIVPIAKALFWDVLCQRRLYRLSVRRWVIHSLIFLPIMLRFIWGVTALCATNWLPDWPRIWALVDKNYPATAFFYDLTGLMILVGIVLAWVRGATAQRSRVSGLPAQDRLALVLIGGIVLVGFLLEGMRITLTGTPDGAHYAFLGFAISKLFPGINGLAQMYGYVWYMHAVLTGALIAYLPFSRLIHIVMAPVVLAMNAAADDHN